MEKITYLFKTIRNVGSLAFLLSLFTGLLPYVGIFFFSEALGFSSGQDQQTAIIATIVFVLVSLSVYSHYIHSAIYAQKAESLSSQLAK